MTKKTQAKFRKLRERLTTQESGPQLIKSENALRQAINSMAKSDAGITARDIEKAVMPRIGFSIYKSKVKAITKEVLK